MRIALITGASSGLGREFAKRIDTQEILIDEIWLIARREDRLKELAETLSHPCRILALDLTKAESFEIIRAQLESESIQVGLLVNCAGYAKIGNYARIDTYDSLHMIDLNCKAAVSITLTALPHMRAHDRIIHICSCAAFQPLQHINIYASTKAFLYSYTRALRLELLPRRIAVTAVCPFWIKDTEFIHIANGYGSNTNSAYVDYDEKPPIRHFPFAVKAERVAKQSLLDSRLGFAVSTPGIFCFIHRLFAKILPRKVLLYIWELARRL